MDLCGKRGYPQIIGTSVSTDFAHNIEKFEKKLIYSKTCLKRPLKKKTKNWFSIPIIA